MELVITDFFSEAKMVEVFFIYFYLKKSTPFFLPLSFLFILVDLLNNKAGYTATPIACGWAGVIFEVTRPFG